MSNTRKAASAPTAETEATAAPVVVEFREHTYEIDADVFDDVTLAADLSDFGEGNPGMLRSILERILGADQYRRFADEQSNDKGRLKFEVAADFVSATVGKLSASQ